MQEKHVNITSRLFIFVLLCCFCVASCTTDAQHAGNAERQTNAVKNTRKTTTQKRKNAAPEETKQEVSVFVPLVVDLHTDATYNLANRSADLMKNTRYQLDIPKLRKGGVNVVFFVIWAEPQKAVKEGYYHFSVREAKALLHFFDANKNVIARALTAKDIQRITASGKIAAVLAIEGGHSVDDENVDVALQRLHEFYDYGARYMSMTWNNSNRLGVSAFDARGGKRKTKGLSDAGKKVAREMVKLGMLLDVSHVSEDTFWDIIHIAKEFHAPVLASHSNARALCNHVRNLTDEQLKAVAETGGAVGINFIATFLKRGGRGAGANVDDVVRHINYVRDLIGVDYIGIGSDYDGFMTPPVGLENAGKMQNLVAALRKTGYRQSDIDKILGLNALRVLRRAEEVSKGLN